MNRIKVLHLTSTRYGIGGVEKLLLDMADKYDESRFEISYCNLFCDKNGKGVFPTRLKEKGFNYFEIKGNRWFDVPGMLLNLIALFRREQIDIVHLHMLKATIVGGLATMFLRQTPTLITKHYTEALSKHNKFIKLLDKYFTRNSNQIIAISNYVKMDMIDNLGVPKEKITVILNGTDIIAANNKADKDAESGKFVVPGKIVIGTVGSLTKRKGHEYLIRAMKIVSQEYQNVSLVIAGEGPERLFLEQLISELEISSKVKMLGFVENVASLMRSIDLYVHPSIHEPFGIVILEAMVAKKCVIAAEVEGVPEIVDSGQSGYLVPPRDIDALASAISKTLALPEEMKRLGENGRRIVEEEFNIQKTVSSYQDLYFKTLDFS